MIEEQKNEVAISDKVSENSRKHFKYRSNECLNCGQPLDLSDRFCPYCSQLNSTKSLTLGDFISEFFSSIISYDSRLRFTVKDLLFKPGTISKNYIGGKRLKYTNPFRFFLSVSIIYFLIYSIVSFFDPNYAAPLVDFNDNTEEEIDDAINTIEEASAIPNTYIVPGTINDTITGTVVNQELLTDLKTQLEDIKKDAKEDVKKDEATPGFWIMNGDTIYSNTKSYPERIAKLDSANTVSGIAMKFQIFRDFYEDKEIKDPNKALDSLHLEKTRFNKWLYQKNKSFDNIGDSPKDFVNYLLSKVPFFVFFFAPFYALFFWLFYARRKFTYMEHLVFIFHIFSFVFLALIITTIPDLIFDTEFFTSLIFLIIGPVYFYLALRKFYMQSRTKTAIKFILLNIVFFFSSIIAALVFFAGTAALY